MKPHRWWILPAALALAVPLEGQDRPARRPVPVTYGEKTGFIPLCDMSEGDRHKGEDGGLYGGGQNEPPAAHREAARKAASAIRPLDAEGNPSPAGKIVLVSIGMSNTHQEFSAFLRMAGPEKGEKVVIVDGAQGGQAAIQWNTPEAAPWGELERRLRAAGVAPLQVQAAWIKQALIAQGQYGEFPAHARRLQEELARIVRIAKTKFPNLRLAYLSSRIYAGYARSNLNPEPYAYEGAFSVRWLIQDQIKGLRELNFDPERGEVVAPILLWGPYLWADGLNPRKNDGLIWKESDLGKDGTHPSEDGKEKVARLLLRFFREDPTARPWFAP